MRMLRGLFLYLMNVDNVSLGQHLLLLLLLVSRCPHRPPSWHHLALPHAAHNGNVYSWISLPAATESSLEFLLILLLTSYPWPEASNSLPNKM